MDRNSIKVLIVDDEKAIVEWLIQSMEWEVYNCEVVGYATSAPEAMRYMEEHALDLLITDICMPEMSGIDLIKWVKTKYENISIIVISAFDKFAYVKEAFQYGIIDYCLKPIDMNELYTCLKTIRTSKARVQMKYVETDVMLFQQSIFQRLLNGVNNISQLKEQCLLAEISLEVPMFQVVLIDMRCLEKEKYTYAMNLLNKEENSGFYTFLDAYMNLVCLFIGEKQCDRETEKRIQYNLQQKCGVYDAFLCIGKPLERYQQIAESYQACRDFLNASFLFSGHVVRLGEYPYEKYQQTVKNKELQNLLNSLKKEKEDSVISIIQKRIDNYRTENQKKAELICLAVFLIKHICLTIPHRTIPLSEECLDIQFSSGKMLDWIKHFYHILIKGDDNQEFFHPHVKYALHEINNHYMDKNISLHQVAQSCNVSAGYLGQIFREQTGEFFNDYLLRVRLGVAETYLMEGKLRVAEIAEKVGFSSQSYFNKMFRINYGISPAAYGRSYHKG